MLCSPLQFFLSRAIVSFIELKEQVIGVQNYILLVFTGNDMIFEVNDIIVE
tara:strand:+ start:1149 stop:1301 length:153 start_codon:yes stop_codon:yes gene_type:complete